jgi:hypothetical protein
MAGTAAEPEEDHVRLRACGRGGAQVIGKAQPTEPEQSCLHEAATGKASAVLPCFTDDTEHAPPSYQHACLKYLTTRAADVTMIVYK